MLEMRCIIMQNYSIEKSCDNSVWMNIFLFRMQNDWRKGDLGREFGLCMEEDCKKLGLNILVRM